MSTTDQAADVIVGIDLGTTNSAVAVCRNGRIDIVAEDGNELLPSCVALTEDGNLIVGEEARNQLVVHPERTVRSVKRKMGSSETISLGERDFSSTEISAIILRELKSRAERFLGSQATRAVITVPAYFSDAQRQATRDAGAMAGLDVLRIVNEPTAACLAYETHEATSSRKILAYDFGGGTFDVSIVNMEDDLVEVTGSHGDTHLGGDDVDETIVGRLLGELAAENNDADDITLTAISKNRLRRAAETAKIRLSEQTHVRVIEENLETESGERLHLDTELSRDNLADLVQPFLDRTINSARQALTTAGITPREIDEVLLVGGSTRLTAVSDRLQQEFGRRPRADVHPDLAVVYGAGVMAARLMGEQNQRILVDITPYTFGTAALGYLNNEYCPHLFCPVIRTGTPLPAKRSELFYTSYDGQESVRVTIFEGENKDARRNILIGQFMVEGLDEDAPAGSEFVLSMELDLDGILRVTATEKATGLSKDIVIEKTLGKVSDEDIKASRAQIEELFGEALNVQTAEVTDREDTDITQEDDEEHELRRQARHLLRRLRESRSRMDEVDREDADQLSEKLREALEENDEEAMQDATTEADDLLFYVDSAI